jgi:hypothetical protein
MTNNRLALAVGGILLTVGSTVLLDHNIYISLLGYLAAIALWFVLHSMDYKDVVESTDEL